MFTQNWWRWVYEAFVTTFHLQNTERLELSIYLMGVCLIASTQLQNQNNLLKSGVVVFQKVFILPIAGLDRGRLSASQTSWGRSFGDSWLCWPHSPHLFGHIWCDALNEGSGQIIWMCFSMLMSTWRTFALTSAYLLILKPPRIFSIPSP